MTMQIHGLDIIVHPGVYPPSDDSYLLVDSIDFQPDDVVLDVGCGTGLVSLIAAMRVYKVVATDVSHAAVRNTKENLRRNYLEKTCEVVQTDLLSILSPEVTFSKILFNPPYLPEDDTQTDMDHALVGGRKGTELTERFIRTAKEHLRSDGELFVVASSLSDVQYIKSVIVDVGLQGSVVAKKPLFFEKLYVLKGAL
jgi:release factor glutamine methyltransferase